MNTYLLPFSAIVIGAIIALLTKNKKTWNTKLLLSFSGSFLLALTLFELLPEVYEHLDTKLAGLFIMCGIMLQLVLELFSKGAEHGHVHIHKHESAFPWLLFISLCFSNMFVLFIVVKVLLSTSTFSFKTEYLILYRILEQYYYLYNFYTFESNSFLRTYFET